MRVLLVPVADRPESRVSLDVAFTIAKRLGGNVVGCHVRPHREEEGTAGRSHSSYLVPDRARFWSRKGGAPELDSKAAAALFEGVVERRGFRLVKRPGAGRTSIALWKEMVGTPARIFAIIGPVADLSVVSRPKAKSSGPAEAFLLSALLHSGKPVLVLPQKRASTPGRRILIAWNQSTDAAAAVAATLPIVTSAEQVTILSCGREDRPGPKSTYLAEYLSHWGVKAERKSTRGDDVPREIIEVFGETGSDLLLMGAYSRQRLRELVFGGVTETMLFHSELPVLMLHR